MIIKFNSFYTRHFGGAYAFRSDGKTRVVISRNKEIAAECKKTGKSFIDLNNKFEVLNFLEEEGLIEFMSQKDARRNLSILDPRLFFMVVEHIHQTDPEKDLTVMKENEIKQYVYSNFDKLPEYFHELVRLTKKLENNQVIDYQNVPLDILPYFVRAKDDPELKNMVNQLIAEYTGQILG